FKTEATRCSCDQRPFSGDAVHCFNSCAGRSRYRANRLFRHCSLLYFFWSVSGAHDTCEPYASLRSVRWVAPSAFDFFRIRTTEPLFTNETSSMSILIRYIPRPCVDSRFSGEVGSGTASLLNPGPSSRTMIRTSPSELHRHITRTRLEGSSSLPWVPAVVMA